MKTPTYPQPQKSEPDRACIRCNVVMPAGCFSRDKQRRDGRRPYCKACASDMHRAWRKENRPPPLPDELPTDESAYLSDDHV